MISVCMATYNGGKYLRQQIDSILPQLQLDDELIISDDGSSDNTFDIIKSYNSPNIKLYHNNFRNHILNFEFLLSVASGDYIFLSDQDDVWFPNKIPTMMHALKEHDLVCSDCVVTDENLDPDGRLFMTESPEKISGFMTNLWHNHYLGCCLAFKRSIRDIALPFPKGLITHDTWLGLVAEMYGNPVFITEKLIYFRRHDQNQSSTLCPSRLSWGEKISYRLVLIMGILKRLKYLFRKSSPRKIT